MSLTEARVASAQDDPQVRVVRNDRAQRVDVYVADAPFTSYVYPKTIKKPVLYPIRASSGTIVTRGFPLLPRVGERVDHPHQVGLWFTYGDVNGLDFWNNSDAIPVENAPKMGTIVHRAVRKTEDGAGQGALEVTADWVDYQGRPLLREDTRFIFRASGVLRSIERITTLRALDKPVSFTDNKEGMFGLRVARALEQPSTTPEVFTDTSGRPTSVPVRDTNGVTGKYRSAEGLEGDAVWGTRARWTMLTGSIDGRPVTLAILDHPKNIGFPTYWHARGYGLFAANNLGQKAMSNGKEELNYKLAPGQALTFRHRLVILSAAASPAQIEDQYREFAQSGVHP